MIRALSPDAAREFRASAEKGVNDLGALLEFSEEKARAALRLLVPEVTGDKLTYDWDERDLVELTRIVGPTWHRLQAGAKERR